VVAKIPSFVLLAVVVMFGPKAAESGATDRARLYFPEERTSFDAKHCEIYLLLRGLNSRAYEDIVRTPDPDDIVNWLVGVTPNGHAYFALTPQPALNAHTNMLRILDGISGLRTDGARVIPIGGGETRGDYSQMNDFAGTFAERKIPNSLADSVVLLRESNGSRELLPAVIHQQSWEEGHLNGETISRGEDGHFESLFHDARNAIAVVLGSFTGRQEILKLSGATAAEKYFRRTVGALRKPHNIDPILRLIQTQSRGNTGLLPKGLVHTSDLLIKARDGELLASGCALGESEIETLAKNLTAILVGLSNQPVEVHFLGTAARDHDGKFHIVQQPSAKPQLVSSKVALPGTAH
jgi:hypothetical protein